MSDFIKDIHAACVRHGIEFMAFAARDYEGTPVIYHHSYSIGVDHLMRRDQAAKIHFDLMGLADEIRREMWSPPLKDT